MKKTRLGAGAKANHLAYLGDARSARARTSAPASSPATTTASRKHPTAIGAGAFIGSDTQLVAPVTVGDGAYVAAGSTVTEDVPAGALAIGRGAAGEQGWLGGERRAAPAK